jgi:hypothetical protein
MCGFTLLPVVLAMSLIASIAFMLNRTNALTANIVESRSDFERARYAAEAGLQAVNYVIQQDGCIGIYPTAGAPLVDTAFAGSTYSAYASSPVGSPLTLTSTGTHNGASVTLSRNNAYVYQSGVRTYVHQPNAATGIDVFISSLNKNTNYGTSSELAITASTYESLLKFNLSFFPAGSRVVPYASGGALAPGALLELYKISAGSWISPGYIDALVITETAWLEGTGGSKSGASWREYDGNNPWPVEGVGYDSRPASTNVAQSGSGWQGIDLTDAVRAWMGPMYANTGVWLRSSPSGNPITGARYHSSDSSDSSRRPRLTLNYLLPCWVSAP